MQKIKQTTKKRIDRKDYVRKVVYELDIGRWHKAFVRIRRPIETFDVYG